MVERVVVVNGGVSGADGISGVVTKGGGAECSLNNKSSSDIIPKKAQFSNNTEANIRETCFTHGERNKVNIE